MKILIWENNVIDTEGIISCKFDNCYGDNNWLIQIIRNNKNFINIVSNQKEREKISQLILLEK